MSLFRSDGRYYDVNFFEYTPADAEPESLPLSALFFKVVSLFSLGDECLDLASKCRQWFGVNKVLWGVRKDAKGYSLEFYFYYPAKYPKNSLSSVVNFAESFYAIDINLPEIGGDADFYLTSMNITDGVLSDINVYKSLLDPKSDPFYFEDKGLIIDRNDPRFCSFSLWNVGDKPKKMNNYWGYFDGKILHRLLSRVYCLAARKFPAEPPLKSYDFLECCYEYCRNSVFSDALVADKDNAIGLYFLHLNIDEFISFLSAHGYEAAFINYIKNNKKLFSHIKFDVGLDFYLSDGGFHIKKTAFWGTL
jgi:hypothetical protein|tara:strand:+ start:6756 stop:7673 length:918 start_codon:yes stop_codon:yes gene_type:complete